MIINMVIQYQLKLKTVVKKKEKSSYSADQDLISQVFVGLDHLSPIKN